MYEIHVTVKKADEAGFALLCEEQKARPILIELPKTADHHEQLMCSKWVTGNLANALNAAKQFSQAAREKGFVPIREKIEQAFSSAPDGFVPSKSKGEYWEFHYKLHLLNKEVGDELNAKILADTNWESTTRMSRSALRDTAPDGGVYRIVTLRLYDGGKAEAKAKCEGLKAWMEQLGYNVTKIQRELSVYDDHLKLDNGWI